MPLQYTYSDIEEAEEAVETIRDQYLRERGWSFVSDTTGSLWVWEKHLDGKTYRMNADSAAYIQSFVDYWQEPPCRE